MVPQDDAAYLSGRNSCTVFTVKMLLVFSF